MTSPEHLNYNHIEGSIRRRSSFPGDGYSLPAPEDAQHQCIGMRSTDNPPSVSETRGPHREKCSPPSKVIPQGPDLRNPTIEKVGYAVKDFLEERPGMQCDS